MEQSLKIITKWSNILEVQGLIPFQINCLLCGWDIITNIFPVYLSLIFALSGAKFIFIP
jgi:hypothetical protein